MNDFEEATLIASKTTYDATDCDKHPFPVLYIPSVGCAMCHIKELQLENKQLRDALAEYRQAMEFTRQYVGYDMLPPIKGWSWYDADCIAKALLEKE